MKRDFSESTINQIAGVLRNKEGLYTNDISSVDLFVCKNVDSTDLSVCNAEIDESVNAANAVVRNSNLDVNDLVEKIYDWSYSASELDLDCKTIVEEDVSCTVDSYMGDLQVFVDALTVTGENAYDFRELPIFSSSSEFSEELNTELYERLYNDLVTENGVDANLLEQIMQGDSLTDRELEVLANMVNNEFVNADGTINSELAELFFECSYKGEVVVIDGDHEGIVYNLTGAYKEFADYYYTLTYIVTQADLGPEIKNDPKYNAMMTLNGMFYGVNHHHSQIIFDDLYSWDDEVGDWVYNDLDFTINNVEPKEIYDVNNPNTILDENTKWSYVSIEINQENSEKMRIFEYDNLSQTIPQNTAADQGDGKKDAYQIYVDTLQQGVYDYVSSQLEGGVIGAMPGSDWIQLALDIHNMESDALEAYDQAVQHNAHAESMIDQSNYASLCADASGINTPAFGTVVGYGDQYTVVNHTIDEEQLAHDVAVYNEFAEQNPNDDYEPLENGVQDVLDALYTPTDENIANLYGYMHYS